MRSNSKLPQTIEPSLKSHTLSTRWNSESIDPAWHMVAALENVLTPIFKKQKKKAFEILQSTDNKQISLFINHCATMIQANFKGYKQRKYYRMFLPFYRRFRSLLEAVVAGWRVRRIMKLSTIKKKINSIQEQSSTKTKRIQMRELAYDLAELQRKGNWLQLHKKQTKFKNTQNVSIKNMLRKKENKTNKKPTVQPTKQQQTIKVEKVEEPEQTTVNPFLEMPIKSSGAYNIPVEEPIMTVRNKKKKPIKKQIKQEKKVDTSVHIVAEEESMVEENLLLKTMKYGKKSINIHLQSIKSEKPKSRRGITLTMNSLNEQPEQMDQLNEILSVYRGTYTSKYMGICSQMEKIRKQKPFSTKK